MEEWYFWLLCIQLSKTGLLCFELPHSQLSNFFWWIVVFVSILFFHGVLGSTLNSLDPEIPVVKNWIVVSLGLHSILSVAADSALVSLDPCLPVAKDIFLVNCCVLWLMSLGSALISCSAHSPSAFNPQLIWSKYVSVWDSSMAISRIVEQQNGVAGWPLPIKLLIQNATLLPKVELKICGPIPYFHKRTFPQINPWLRWIFLRVWGLRCNQSQCT